MNNANFYMLFADSDHCVRTALMFLLKNVLVTFSFLFLYQTLDINLQLSVKFVARKLTGDIENC